MTEPDRSARGGVAGGVDTPRLDDPATAAERAALLDAPHMAALEAWRLRIAGDRPVPHADPLDGGNDARLLLLLETPGPGPTPLRFVSRDNATGTARNLRRFLSEAGIARCDMLIWNVVPWLLHEPGARNRPVRAAEVREGLETLPGLLALLPRLQVAVLAGRPAARAEPLLAVLRPDLPVLCMPHPSPTIVCTSPTIGARIAATLSHAASILAG